jgi:hypothetical protein
MSASSKHKAGAGVCVLVIDRNNVTGRHDTMQHHNKQVVVLARWDAGCKDDAWQMIVQQNQATSLNRNCASPEPCIASLTHPPASVTLKKMPDHSCGYSV